MKSYVSALGILALILTVASMLTANDQSPKQLTSKLQQNLAAPVHYADVTVVLADSQGVAAITFHCPATPEPKVSATSDVVEYRYRYRSNGGRETTGQGLVYENYKRDPDHESSVRNECGETHVRAGHFQLEWSQGDIHQGWLYYKPEEVRMWFAGIDHFNALKLSRFSQ